MPKVGFVMSIQPLFDIVCTAKCLQCSIVSFTTRVGEQVCTTYISYTSKTEPIILDMVCSKSMQV